MKGLVFILLLAIPLTSFSVTESLRITGNIYRCETNDAEFFGRGLWICKDSECKEVKVYSGGRFSILGLTKGTFEIRYGNIWRQLLSDTIHLTENMSGYKICIDKFKPRENYPMAEQFKKAETVEIKQYSTGCFHSTKKFIKLKKKGDKYYAEIKTDKGITRSTRPSARDVEVISDFFMKIDLLDGPGGCTTEDKYEIIFDNKAFEIRDATCDWDGFGQLVKQFFNVR